MYVKIHIAVNIKFFIAVKISTNLLKLLSFITMKHQFGCLMFKKKFNIHPTLWQIYIFFEYENIVIMALTTSTN